MKLRMVGFDSSLTYFTMGTAAGVSVEVGQKRTWDRWDMVRIYYKSYYGQ